MLHDSQTTSTSLLISFGEMRGEQKSHARRLNRVEAEIRDMRKMINRRPPEKTDLLPYLMGMILIGLALMGKVQMSDVLPLLKVGSPH